MTYRMPTALACILLAGSVMAQPAAAQQNSVDATIRGQVVDDMTGQGIPGVLVEALDFRDRIRRSATTDTDGNFILPRVMPGSFWLRATQVGYVRTKTPPWSIQSGEVITVTIRLDRQAVLLAPLEVTARSRMPSAVLASFHARLARRAGGTLFSRDDIIARNPSRITDLLEGVPGVQLQNAVGQAGRMVVMSRALPGLGGGTIGGGSCPVQVYVDGVLATRGRSDVSPDELSIPTALEGVEVYRGLATVPPEFLTPEARCGVIALWTRRSRD
jgi:hypothetical protein